MNNNFKLLLKALLICIITMAVLLFVFAFIASKSEDSTKNLQLYARITFLVSAFIPCFVIGRNAESKPLVYSLIFAGIFLLISYGVSLILKNGSFSRLWLPYVSSIGLCIAAPVLSIRKKAKKPKGLKAYKKTKKQ
ncbi:MAG: TIGR04086 family membrane protein [Clostridia bacterium]|nr:TIGR04086 family membrane protein [Clostridia bacterium]